MIRWLRIAMLALILVAVGLASALTAMRLAIHGREVRVPKVTGLSRAQAHAALIGAGLLMDVENRYYSAEVPEGAIISQYPPPNDKVRRGWRVRVAESLGKQQSEVPELIGQSARAAEINVTRRGFSIAHTTSIALPGAAVGTVLSQSPSANAKEITTPKIELLVAAGEPEGGKGSVFVMPVLVGRSVASATQAAEAAGFKVNVRRVAPSAGQQKDAVVAQDPAAGQRVTSDREITLDVAR